MSFVRDLIFALSAALAFTGLYALVSRFPRVSQVAIVWPFLLLFLASWAGGVWLSPVGPPFFGGYVLPFFIVGFLSALVMAASASNGRRGHPGATDTAPKSIPKASIVGISIFLWTLVFSLVAAIVAFYLMRWRPSPPAPPSETSSQSGTVHP